MSVFKRRKKDQLDSDPTDEDADAVAEQTAAADEADGAGAPDVPARLERPQGPWDAADAPERDVPRLDLGALQVPVSEGLEVRVDVNATGQVVAATLVKGQTAMQLSVFAAPRTEGIWAEVREEIAAALAQSGGQATPAEGPFGTELRAAVPTQVPDRGTMLAPARFLGVDGPRWFVRGLITGVGASDPDQAGDVERAFRDVVVVRGGDPMAVRDPLPLRLPPDATAQAGAPSGEQDEPPAQDSGQPQGGDPLPMPERGPEITEIR